MLFVGPLPSSYWAHPSSDILFPGEAGDTPLFLDHSGLLCLIHGLVSPVESGVGAPRTTSLWQMPEKQKGGGDWKLTPWFRVLWKYFSLLSSSVRP